MNIPQEIRNIKDQLRMNIQTTAKNKQYSDYDIEAGRVNTSKAQGSADDANTLAQENEAGIMDVASVASENDGAIMDIAEIASENDGAIVELAEYIANLEERILVLESEVNT